MLVKNKLDYVPCFFNAVFMFIKFNKVKFSCRFSYIPFKYTVLQFSFSIEFCFLDNNLLYSLSLNFIDCKISFVIQIIICMLMSIEFCGFSRHVCFFKFCYGLFYYIIS